MTCKLSQEQIEQTISFHGHWCPGLAIGIRAAEWALSELGRASDEDIVTVTETDMCGVDAIQFLTGCTFGKGNLIHLDYGKNAFSFYRRRDNKSVRLMTRPELFGEDRENMRSLSEKRQSQGLTPEEEQRWHAAREKISSRIMAAKLTDLFDEGQPLYTVPQKARILASLTCEACGEATMETRTRRFQEKTLCLPCFAKAEQS
jgi:formylmethanofuran dehydrogenase subunit E